jgi:hypothetical protein
LRRQPVCEDKDQGLAAAYADAVERLVDVVEKAIDGECDWTTRLSTGLSANLDFLPNNPPVAQLLLVESLAGPVPLGSSTSTP